MKKMHLLIACSLVLACSLNAAAQDYSGTWQAVVTESTSNCKKIVKGRPGEYRLTVAQKGNELTIMENVGRRPYKGVVEAANPGHVLVRATYTDGGGYVSEEVTIEFTESDSGTAQSVWKWSDGWHQCGGSFHFMLNKIRPE